MQILYATDGSEGALAAARLLNELDLNGDDEIVVLTVTGIGEESEGKQRLERTCAALQGNPARLTQAIGCGSAAEVVLQRAEDLNPNFVALGSRGLNAVARFLLGSVAERVVCHSHCPVLVARPLNGELDRVVVGIDGSDASLQTARLVQQLPLAPQCEVRLVTALPFYKVGGTPAARVPSLAAELQALQVRERDEAQARLEEVAAPFREAGRVVRTEFREQPAAAGVLEVAEEQGADLIALGRQGLSRIDRFCMGSVSMNVLRHAACSVLVVPESRSA